MTTNNFQKKAIRERMELTGEAFSVASRAINQLPTPTWPALEAAINGGFQNGTIYLIGSKHGEGRIPMAVNLASKLSRPNNTIAYISMEQTAEELTQKLLAAGTKNNHLDKNIKIVDGTHTITSIREFLSQHQNLTAVIIDYLQLIQLGDKTSKDGSLFPELLPDVVKEFKKIATERNIPVIIMAQLTRNSTVEVNETRITLKGRWDTAITMHIPVVLHLTRSENTLDIHFIKNDAGRRTSITLAWPSADSPAITEL